MKSIKEQQDNPEQCLFQSNVQEIISPYLEKYESYFAKTPLINISEFQHELSKNKIKYSQSKFHSGSIIEVVSRTEKSSIVVLSVSLSYFQFELTILNVDDKSPAKEVTKSYRIDFLQELNRGGNGQILFAFGLDKKYFAIKSIQYKYQGSLENAIVEYCFCKLFSVLKIGPQIKDYLGFDLVVYNSTIEFGMELCSHEKNIKIANFKSNLKLMHSLNIIHGDIKPDNIMWSGQYEFVFVDFGFSKCIQEKPGKMTSDSYFGTLCYSCPEMVQAYFKGISNYFDLYYNDVYGMAKIEQEIKMKTYKFKQNKQIQTNKLIDQQTQKKRKIYLNYLFNIWMKRAIYERDQSKVRKLCQKYKQFSLSTQILQLFLQIPSNNETSKIFKFLTKNYYLQGSERVAQISKYFSGIKLSIKTVDLTPRYRDKADLKQQQKNLSQIERFILLIFFQDISARQKIKKMINLEKIKQKKIQLNDPKAILRLYVDLVQNIYTTKSQVLFLLEKAKQLLEIKEWEFIEQPRLEIFLKAMQIRKAASSKFQLDLFYRSFITDEIENINISQLRNLQDYQKKMFNLFAEFWKDCKRSKLPENLIQQRYFLIKKYAKIEKEYQQIISKQKNPSQIFRIYLNYRTNNPTGSIQKIINKLSYYPLVRKTRLYISKFEKNLISKIKDNYYSQQALNSLLLFQLNSFNSCFQFNNHYILFFLVLVHQKFNNCLGKEDQPQFQYLFQQLIKNYQNYIKIYTNLILKDQEVEEGFDFIIILYNKIFYLKEQFKNKLGNIIVASVIKLYNQFHNKLDQEPCFNFQKFLCCTFSSLRSYNPQFKIQYGTKKQFVRVVKEILVPNLEKYYKNSNNIQYSAILEEFVPFSLPQQQRQKKRKYFIVSNLILIKTDLKLINEQEAMQHYQRIIQQNFLLSKTQDYLQIQFMSSIQVFILQHKSKSIYQKYQSLKQKLQDRIENFINSQKDIKAIPKLSKIIAHLFIYYAYEKNKYKAYNLMLQQYKFQKSSFDVIQIHTCYTDYFYPLIYKDYEKCKELQFLGSQFQFFWAFVRRSGGLERFCTGHSQALVYCQYFLRYLAYFFKGNKSEVEYAVKMMKIGRILMNYNPSSFLNSKFKMICLVISQQFIIRKIYAEKLRRRFKMSAIKKFRLKQFSKSNNKEILLNMISEHFSYMEGKQFYEYTQKQNPKISDRANQCQQLLEPNVISQVGQLIRIVSQFAKASVICLSEEINNEKVKQLFFLNVLKNWVEFYVESFFEQSLIQIYSYFYHFKNIPSLLRTVSYQDPTCNQIFSNHFQSDFCKFINKIEKINKQNYNMQLMGYIRERNILKFIQTCFLLSEG